MKPECSLPPPHRFDREAFYALGVILVFSLVSFAYVYSLHATDLDGDGWAHVKNARILTDSINPGYPQVGTVWLPLFHLLAAPLARNDFLWRTGLAGSLISMMSFVIAGFVLFRMLRFMFDQPSIAWLGLAIFLLNPSWLYYQTTPMQEPLALALLVINVYLLMLWQRESKSKFLFLASLLNALASLNRYEGWFFTLLGTIWVLLAQVEKREDRSWSMRLKEAFIYGFIASLTPLYWLVHNWFMYGDVLEFIRGAYSAKALYLKQIATYHFQYPTDGQWWLSLLYFAKSIRYCVGEVPFWIAVVGFLWGVGGLVFKKWVDPGHHAASVLSWQSTHLLYLVPFAFYVISLAKGRAPTYVVDYYPYTNFAIRYGHTPIPAVVTLSAAVFYFVSQWVRSAWLRKTLVGLLVIVLLFPMGLAVRTHLHSLPAHEEPYVNNGDDRRILGEVAAYLQPRWHGEMILMNSGYLGRVAQLDEIPFRRIFFEGNLWAWEFARRYPFPEIQWIIAEEGDDVWNMITQRPGYLRYYQEEKVVRGIKAHVVHIYRHHAPEE